MSLRRPSGRRALASALLLAALAASPPLAAQSAAPESACAPTGTLALEVAQRGTLTAQKCVDRRGWQEAAWRLPEGADTNDNLLPARYDLYRVRLAAHQPKQRVRVDLHGGKNGYDPHLQAVLLKADGTEVGRVSDGPVGGLGRVFDAPAGDYYVRVLTADWAPARRYEVRVSLQRTQGCGLAETTRSIAPGETRTATTSRKDCPQGLAHFGHTYRVAVPRDSAVQIDVEALDSTPPRLDIDWLGAKEPVDTSWQGRSAYIGVPKLERNRARLLATDKGGTLFVTVGAQYAWDTVGYRLTVKPVARTHAARACVDTLPNGERLTLDRPMSGTLASGACLLPAGTGDQPAKLHPFEIADGEDQRVEIEVRAAGFSPRVVLLSYGDPIDSAAVEAGVARLRIALTSSSRYAVAVAARGAGRAGGTYDLVVRGLGDPDGAMRDRHVAKVWAADSALKAKRYDEGRALAMEVLRENPYDLGALYRLGTWHFSTGTFDGLIRVLDRVMAIEPGNATNAMLYMNAWQLLERSTADAARKQAAADSAASRHRASEAMPVNVKLTRWNLGLVASSVAGEIENRSFARKSFTLVVEFLDRQGRVVATEEEVVAGVPPRGKRDFHVFHYDREKPGIMGFRYRIK